MPKPGRPISPNPTDLPIGFVPPEDHGPDLSLYDSSNPRGLLNLLEGSIKESIQGIPPKYLEMAEDDLRKEVGPDATLCRLRLAFWDEYNRVVNSGTKIQVMRVVKGVCKRDYLYSTVLRDPRKMAWLFTPPTDHMLAQKEILDLGLMELRDMMLTPHVIEEFKFSKDGTTYKVRRADASIMAQKLKAVMVLLDRVHGAVLQKQAVVTKSLDAPVGVDPFDTASLESLERMEAKLEKLQEALSETATEMTAEVVEGDTDETP